MPPTHHAPEKLTMKNVLKGMRQLLDILAAPLVYGAAGLLELVRKVGIRRLPDCKRALLSMGVFPIRNHYYEPLFDPSQLRIPLD